MQRNEWHQPALTRANLEPVATFMAAGLACLVLGHSRQLPLMPRFDDVGPLAIVLAVLSFAGVAAGLIQGLPDEDPDQMSEERRARAVTHYRYICAVPAGVLVIGLLTTLVTPFATGLAALVTAAASCLALTELLYRTDNEELGRVAMNECRRNGYRRAQRDTIAGERLTGAPEPVAVPRGLICAGWLFLISVVLVLWVLAEASHPLFAATDMVNPFDLFATSFTVAVPYLRVAQHVRAGRIVERLDLRVWNAVMALLFLTTTMLVQMVLVKPIVLAQYWPALAGHLACTVGITALLYTVNLRAARNGKLSVFTPVAAGWHRDYLDWYLAQPPTSELQRDQR